MTRVIWNVFEKYCSLSVCYLVINIHITAVSSQEGTETVLLMVTGVRKVWNIHWEHGLWTGIGFGNLFTWVGKAAKDPVAVWAQVLSYQLWSVLFFKLIGFCLLSVERFEVYPFPQRNIPWFDVQPGTHWNWSLQHWQVPGPAAGQCPGDRWGWWGRVPCLLPALPSCSSLSQTCIS